MKLVRCEDCIAWDIIPSDLNIGVCRLKAPILVPIQGADGGMQSMSFQPVMKRGTGCCEGQETPPKITAH